MSKYLDRNTVVSTIHKMQNFEYELKNVFSKYDLEFESNTGRRNQFLSIAQESFLCEELSKKYSGVVSDGRTGQPDIFIGSLDEELECKLTSGHGKSKTYSLQTDWDTIVRKGELDYVYFIASDDFTSFCVLHFDKLTPDNFFPPAPGSRGKSRMHKHSAMKKASVVVGKVENKNKTRIEKLTKDLQHVIQDKKLRIKTLKDRGTSITKNATVAKRKNIEMIAREELRFDKKISKIKSKINMWKNKENQYGIILEKV